MDYTYAQFVQDLNSGAISEAQFCVRDYGHYAHCTVTAQPLPDGGEYIELTLTPDRKEVVHFYGAFRDDKIFRLGRGRRATLRDIWGKIEFVSVKRRT